MNLQTPNYNSVTRNRNDRSRLLTYANQNRNEGFFNDVAIGVGNQCFSANRMVLSCYSDYFQDKFRTKTNYQESVKLDDVDEESIKLIIDYIYSATITIDKQNVVDLLKTAHLLKMNDVKEFCFVYLESTINSDNCIGRINLAKQYENESLLNKYYQHLSNHFDEVSDRIEFKNLSAADLESCISNLIRSELDEILLFEAIASWTKYDQENRLNDFSNLFQLIKLDKLSYDYLMFFVSKQEIVNECKPCLKLILNTLPKVLKTKQLKETGSKILSIGGAGTASKVTQVYPLLNDQVKRYPDLPIKLRDHCSLKLNNIVYCIGGKIAVDDHNVTNKVWQMDLSNETLKWEEISSMNDKRQLAAATIYHDTLIVSNGGDGKNISKKTEIYRKTFKQWKTISPLQQMRMSHAMVVCDGCLLVIGGWYSKQVLSSVERLTDLTSTWEYVASLQTPRKRLASVNCKDCVYAIGGQSGEDKDTRLKSVEKYDADANKWVYVSDMINERCLHSACVLQNKIYVVGGLNSKGNVVKVIECYDPSTDSWSNVGEAVDELYSDSLVVI